ncbi:hypothetical protein [Nocardia amamiensis]|uniref:hypothetical protein n=1 Tax=Nocardia TaxID=1817 RepID=UPI0033DCDD20
MTAGLGRASRVVIVPTGTTLAAAGRLVVAGTAAAQPPQPPVGPNGPVIVCANPDQAAPAPVPPGVVLGECPPHPASTVVIAPARPSEPSVRIQLVPDCPGRPQLRIERRMPLPPGTAPAHIVSSGGAA